MSSRPGRKIARVQAQRERSGRRTAAEIHERRRRSTIIMGIVLLAVTVGVVSALLWSRRDEGDPDLVVTPTIEPTDLDTLLPADATSTTIAGTDTTTVAATDTTTIADTDTTTTVAG